MFEMVPHHERDDTVVFMECFTSQEAHETHMTKDYAQAFLGVMGPMMTGFRFENLYASGVEVQSPD